MPFKITNTRYIFKHKVSFGGPFFVLVVTQMIHILFQEKTDKVSYYLIANVQKNVSDSSSPRVKNKKIKVDSNLVLKLHIKISETQNMIKW